MNCDFVEHERNELGLRRMRCTRCGHLTKSWSPYGPEEHRDFVCKSFPRVSEWREWLSLFVDALGGDAATLVAFIRWRAKGSPIDQLPPGVPAPNVPPKNAGLTDNEVADLLPDESDQTLIGNRIAALTTALGIPPCDSCGKRKEWLNAAHLWLRG
jgi:hypothetical protein